MTLSNNENLPAQIYNDLKHKIQEFEYKPGERLSEPSLAKHYGISRTPIKQAITILEVNGIVSVTPNVGTFINKIDTAHLSEFFTMRKLLEIGILDEFKSNYTEEDITALQTNLLKQDDLVANYTEENRIQSSKMFWYLDNEFHRIIFKAVNKEYLWEHIINHSLQANRFRVLSVSIHQDDLLVKVKEHHTLYKYLTTDLELDVNAHYDKHLFKTLETNIKELQEEFPEYFE
ncbi:GntR family transcriptional regulator [Mollicutes bacterium LVI A0039]|nr:GntR family transcriptional regulator [Mollicutes bacterium LVI A0039]